MCAQDLDALTSAIHTHQSRCEEHAESCCGFDSLYVVASGPDESPITADGPVELGHECTCGWRDTIDTTTTDMITLLHLIQE